VLVDVQSPAVSVEVVLVWVDVMIVTPVDTWVVAQTVAVVVKVEVAV